MKKSHFILSAAVKLSSAAAFFYGMIKTFDNITAFTKFTYISAIFSFAVTLLSFAFDVAILFSRARKKPNAIYALKYCAAMSSALTFFAYMLFLAPNNARGFFGAYMYGDGGSLCLHALLPLICTADFFAFDYRYAARPFHLVLSCAFPIAYLVAVFIMGAEGFSWNGLPVPYSFLNYTSAGWFSVELFGASSAKIGVGYILAALFLAYIALGLLYLKIISLRRRRAYKKSSRIVIALVGEGNSSAVTVRRYFC